MPRLALIAAHVAAVAILAVVAYKLLLEDDGQRMVGGVNAHGNEVLAVKGQLPGGGPGGSSGSGGGSGGGAGAVAGAAAGGAGGGAAGGASGAAGSQPFGSPGGAGGGGGAGRSFVLNSPTAVQYGDQLSLIQTKLGN